MRMGYKTYGIRRAISVFTAVMITSATGVGTAQACSTEPYLGDVCMTAATYCPSGYEEMVGQIMLIADNSALFALLGCKWGGDCRTSYGIPDMRGRAPIGAGQGPGLTGISLGQWAGQEQVVLTVDQLPSHKHAAQAAVQADVTVSLYEGVGASPTPSSTNNTLHAVGENAFTTNSKANIYGPASGAEILMGGVSDDVNVQLTVDRTGQSFPLNIQNPIMAMTYCIAAKGVFPPHQ